MVMDTYKILKSTKKSSGQPSSQKGIKDLIAQHNCMFNRIRDYFLFMNDEVKPHLTENKSQGLLSQIIKCKQKVIIKFEDLKCAKKWGAIPVFNEKQKQGIEE